jgi:DNA processing protein
MLVESDEEPVVKGAASPQGTAGVSPEALVGALNPLELKFAPKRLYISGPLPLPLPHPRVAIIGTRQPTGEGTKLARTLASSLVRQGVLVVSGLARGIDTAAHTAAIEAGGKTVAVLGTPLSKSYPRENSDLQARIEREFLIVSQFEAGRPTLPANFVQRNRTMALISDATVIIESGDSGGSLHQGWEALRLGRPLFIHSREFERPGIQWPRKMAEYGAVEFRRPSDVLEAVPRSELGLAIATTEPT